MAPSRFVWAALVAGTCLSVSEAFRSRRTRQKVDMANDSDVKLNGDLTRQISRVQEGAHDMATDSEAGVQVGKIITLIRHGQGYHNVAYNYDIIDPSLTPVGIEEAEDARDHNELEGIDLLVVSPLARAIETATVIFGNDPKVPTFIQKMAAERAGAPCDVGSVKSELAMKFPYVTEWGGWQELEENWMYNTATDAKWRDQRVPEFVAWLKSRPEKHIAVVGHGAFFSGVIKYVSGYEHNMRNAEVLSFEI